ncbi:flavodoxin family protein [Xylocopilactobacillus apis]|uniref:NADPH-dependent FMN reductase-like domain-containing protein n=1 Tax=Xylocopilactobacillus apis TaxID=2932183 RepID=A0AAU9DCB5_9LACO|nr:NAD(P)H-dependent oxidoreductase [Xylocopilactobacillus apis]BDR57420.1 hypothetical protein KIMC2_19820 [Xylocopilactobacillus apis]
MIKIEIIFVNASQNKSGNTSRMGEKYLQGKAYEQMNLVDYKIYQLNQNYSDDQFEQAFSQLNKADWIVLGTPVYWHDMSAYLKTLLERLSQDSHFDDLSGKRISVLIQGSDPSDTIKPVTNIIKRFANSARMEFVDAMEDF